MIYTTNTEIDKIPDNKDIWAYAYKEDERACNLMCKPVKGCIKGREFYERKKKDSGYKKNGVLIHSRYYADTYEEARKGFNTLVYNRITKLQNGINELSELLIAPDFKEV